MEEEDEDGADNFLSLDFATGFPVLVECSAHINSLTNVLSP